MSSTGKSQQPSHTRILALLDLGRWCQKQSPISFSSDIHRKRWVTFFPKIIVDAKINVVNLQLKLQMRKNFYFDVFDLLNRVFCLN